MYDLLSWREKDVLKLVAMGMSTPQIARRLNIAERTVESHRNNIRSKLDSIGLASDRQGMVAYAIELGFLQPFEVTALRKQQWGQAAIAALIALALGLVLGGLLWRGQDEAPQEQIRIAATATATATAESRFEIREKSGGIYHCDFYSWNMEKDYLVLYGCAEPPGTFIFEGPVWFEYFKGVELYLPLILKSEIPR